jgi:ATP-dependent Clp protease ATP-binding subunit ClpC
MGHARRGTGHLLLGLLAEDQGLAARVLEHLGVTGASVHAGMMGKVYAVEHDSEDEIPFTPRADAVLKYAGKEAASSARQRIDTEHILLGLTRETEGVAMVILMELGLGPKTIRREIMRMLPPNRP